jgi:serine/threonine protein kinase
VQNPSSTPQLPSPVPGLSDLTVIARGGYSTVYRARQDSVGREVALKIDTRSLEEERDRRRFLREAEAAGRMSGHPNVVNVYDAGVTSDNHPYLVMELCSGGSYAGRLKKEGPLGAAEVRDVGVKIADALHAAHTSGILHRDVKPGNILINAYGVPGLADFGLAALPDPARELSVTIEALTPAYAPPEVFRLEKPTPAGDVYALAASLYALLSGRPPRWPDTGSPSLATMIRLHEEPLPDLPGVPIGLTNVLRQGMAGEIADRYPSAAAFRDALKAASLDEESVTTPISAPPAGWLPFAPGSGGAVPGAQTSAPPGSAQASGPPGPAQASGLPGPAQTSGPPSYAGNAFPPPPYGAPPPYQPAPYPTTPISTPPYPTSPPGYPPPAPPGPGALHSHGAQPGPGARPGPAMHNGAPPPAQKWGAQQPPPYQPAYPHPGYPQQPYPPVQPPKKRSGWIILGVFALVVLVLISAVIAIQSLLPDDNERTSGGPTTSSSPRPTVSPAASVSVTPDLDDLAGGILGECPLGSVSATGGITARCPTKPECWAGINDIGGQVSARTLPCNRAHSWETYLIGVLPASVTSNDAETVANNELIKVLCGQQALSIALNGESSAGWSSEILPPSKSDFNAGKREFRCVAGKGLDALDKPVFGNN